MATLSGEEQLQRVADQLDSGEQVAVTIRTLLGWFDYQRRRVETVIPKIRSALEDKGLTTVPALPAWEHSLDTSIEFRKVQPDAIVRRRAARILNHSGKRWHMRDIEKFEAALEAAGQEIVLRGGETTVCGLTMRLPDYLSDALISYVARELLDGLPGERDE